MDGVRGRAVREAVSGHGVGSTLRRAEDQRGGNGIAPNRGGEQAGADAEAARAGLYALLSNLLARPADAAMLARLGVLAGDDSTLGQALGRLGQGARESTIDAIEDEYGELFYGMGQGGEVLPYASYYLTGHLYDRPLARLRGDMERLGIARDDENREPEDHIAFLFEAMHGLITGRFGAGRLSVAAQRRFFDAHVATWADDFFADLGAAEAARFYRHVAEVGRLFMAIERDAFQMAA